MSTSLISLDDLTTTGNLPTLLLPVDSATNCSIQSLNPGMELSESVKEIYCFPT